MINGFHTLIYSDDPDATRAFFRDVLGWPWLDAHGGWLIFKTPPSELGVHPTEGGSGEHWADTPHHAASLMCDDIEATVAELRAKGVEVSDEIDNQGLRARHVDPHPRRRDDAAVPAAPSARVRARRLTPIRS